MTCTPQYLHVSDSSNLETLSFPTITAERPRPVITNDSGVWFSRSPLLYAKTRRAYPLSRRERPKPDMVIRHNIKPPRALRSINEVRQILESHAIHSLPGTSTTAQPSLPLSKLAWGALLGGMHNQCSITRHTTWMTTQSGRVQLFAFHAESS